MPGKRSPDRRITTIAMDKSLFEQVRKEAKRRDISVSKLVVTMITEGMQTRREIEARLEDKTLRKVLGELMAHPDLAKRLPEVLKEMHEADRAKQQTLWDELRLETRDHIMGSAVAPSEGSKKKPAHRKAVKRVPVPV